MHCYCCCRAWGLPWWNTTILALSLTEGNERKTEKKYGRIKILHSFTLSGTSVSSLTADINLHGRKYNTLDQGKGEALYHETVFLWTSCRFPHAKYCSCQMCPHASVTKTQFFLSKQHLAILTCSKTLPKDTSWVVVLYLSTCALYLGCRAAAEDLHTAQQETFLHKIHSSL